MERASELATAAATPSSTSSVIQMRLEAFAYTLLLYSFELDGGHARRLRQGIVV